MEIQQIGSDAIRTLNDVGNHTVNKAKEAMDFAKTKIAENKDSFEFTNGLKEKFKEKSITKETAVGAGVIVAGLILAIKCLKGIGSSLKSLKSKN